MRGLCEGGNEPPGFLKASKIKCISLLWRTYDSRRKIYQDFANITPQMLLITWMEVGYMCSANDNSAYRCSANDKSALYRYKTASIDYSRICNRKRISEKSRRLEIQYCRRRQKRHRPWLEPLKYGHPLTGTRRSTQTEMCLALKAPVIEASLRGINQLFTAVFLCTRSETPQAGDDVICLLSLLAKSVHASYMRYECLMKQASRLISYNLHRDGTSDHGTMTKVFMIHGVQRALQFQELKPLHDTPNIEESRTIQSLRLGCWPSLNIARPSGIYHLYRLSLFFPLKALRLSWALKRALAPVGINYNNRRRRKEVVNITGREKERTEEKLAKEKYAEKKRTKEWEEARKKTDQDLVLG
ncbi:hypothetical protein ANN_10781 [Periplaneta americana]|uniref:Uncharacterized protein n=1 Tax=Periplaneta americana TaxID=6978 RepID=A0ABQ8T4Y4_PERAM|nr:hypothetical protein ANN_10781 [Periplaneta americana]